MAEQKKVIKIVKYNVVTCLLSDRNQKIYDRRFKGKKGPWMNYINGCMNKDFKLNKAEEIYEEIKVKRETIKMLEKKMGSLQREWELLNQKSKDDFMKSRGIPE